MESFPESPPRQGEAELRASKPEAALAALFGAHTADGRGLAVAIHAEGVRLQVSLPPPSQCLDVATFGKVRLKWPQRTGAKRWSRCFC